MIEDFKAFIARGNVLDLAVAVIIGAAFATITTSLTEDIIMPIVGAIFGGFDFSNYFIRLGTIPPEFTGNPLSYEDLKSAGVPAIGWGQFVTVLLNFLILAFIIFLMVRFANRVIGEQQEKEKKESGPTEVELLTQIRDELRKP